MGDDFSAHVAMDVDGTPTGALRRIADALGKPVSEFYRSSIFDHEAVVLLTLVQDYLSRVDPDTRGSFTRAVEAMVAEKPTA